MTLREHILTPRKVYTIEKAKKRGPYSTQPGRKPGKGAGKIVSGIQITPQVTPDLVMGKWMNQVKLPTKFSKAAFEFWAARFVFSPQFTGKNIEEVPGSELFTKGKVYKSIPLTDKEKVELGHILGSLSYWKKQQCYHNAQVLAMYHPELKYVEGFVDVHGVPISHAWVTYNGKVVDTTIRKNLEGRDTGWNNRNMGTTDHEYFGVEISTKEMTKAIMKMETHSSIIEEWKVRQYIKNLPPAPEPKPQGMTREKLVAGMMAMSEGWN